MLGNYDEYYTVNGEAHGDPHSGDGNIMNNPANDPSPSNFSFIADQVTKSGKAGDCQVVN